MNLKEENFEGRLCDKFTINDNCSKKMYLTKMPFIRIFSCFEEEQKLDSGGRWQFIRRQSSELAGANWNVLKVYFKIMESKVKFINELFFWKWIMF